MRTMETLTSLPVDRETFTKQLDVAISQFGLVYPCMLKNAEVNLYKLYCLVHQLKLRNGGEFSYDHNISSWRRIAEELGSPGDTSAVVLFKIYKKYITDALEVSSGSLAGVHPKKQLLRKPSPFIPRCPQDGLVRPKRTYRKRQKFHERIPGVRGRPRLSTLGGAYSPAPSPRAPSGGGCVRMVTPTTMRFTPRAEQQQFTTLRDCSTKEGKLQPPEDMVSQPPESILSQPPEGMVEIRGHNEVYLADDGVLPRPTGDPEKYDVEPLMRQLECTLPNEVQFGINMLLWMTKTWPLPLPKYPKLISLLIANSGLRTEQQKRYWEDDSMCEYWRDTQQSEHFFNSGFKSERVRAVQISVILCNLCHVTTNVEVLLKHPHYLTYLEQSIKSSCLEIRNNGLTSWSFLADQVRLEEVPQSFDFVIRFSLDGLKSADRFLVSSGLSCINSLCKHSSNHVYMVDHLSGAEYELMVNLLLAPDAALLHAALEAVYSLTSIGAETCERFLCHPHLVSTLVDLFSVMAERLEHRGLKVLRYVERKVVPAPQPTPRVYVHSTPYVPQEVSPDLKTSSLARLKINATKVKLPHGNIPAGMKATVSFARSWIVKNIQASKNSILLKCAVYSKYLKAADAKSETGQPEVVSPGDFFILLSNIFPESFRQKISVGEGMKFVVKNIDWLRNCPAPAVRDQEDLVVNTPKPKNKIVARSLDFATPAFDFPVDDDKKKKKKPMEMKDDSRKRKKKETETKSSTPVAAVVVEDHLEDEESCAMIIEEDLVNTTPEIIEETDEVDSRVQVVSTEFPKPPGPPARVMKTYGKRKLEQTRYSSDPYRFSEPPRRPGQFDQYKKTVKLDLNTTPEKHDMEQKRFENAARAFDASPTFDKPSSPVFGKSSSPTFDKPSSPVFGKSSSPTFDKPSSPVVRKSSSPTFDKPSSPVFSKSSSPTFDKPSSPVFGKSSSPIFDKPSSPVFGKSSSPTFDKPSSPAFGKSSSPTFDKPSSPVFGKSSSPTFDKPTSPVVGKSSSPTFDKPSSPVFGKCSSPTFDKPSSPVVGKSSSPTFDKPSSPVFGKSSSPTFDKTSSLVVRKSSSPTFDKPSLPVFGKSSSPTFDKPSSPMVGKSSSSTFDKPPSPVVGKSSSPTFDKPSSPVFGKSSSPTFDKPSSLVVGKSSSPTFDKPSSPVFGKSSKVCKSPSPVFGKSSSPTFKRPSPVFRRSPQKLDKPSSPVLGRSSPLSKSSATANTRMSPTFEKSPVGNPSVCNRSPEKSPRKFNKTEVEKTAALDSKKEKRKSEETPLSPVAVTKTSIFDETRVTIKSPKLKISDDIFVSQAVVDTVPYTPEQSTITYTSPTMYPRKHCHSTQTELKHTTTQTPPKEITKTTVSNHDVIKQQLPTVISPLKKMAPGQQVYLLPQQSQQHVVQVSPQKVYQQVILAPPTSQQIFIPNNTQQQRPTSQQIFIPNNAQQLQRPTSQQIFIPNNAQQLQRPTSQQIFIPNQGNSTQQQQRLIFVPNNNPASTQQVVLAQPSQPAPQLFVQSSQTSSQQVFVQPQNNPVQQILIMPGSQQIIVSPAKSQTSQKILIAPQQQPQQVLISQASSRPSGPILLSSQPQHLSGQLVQVPPQNQVLCYNPPQSSQIVLAPSPVFRSSSPSQQILVPLSRAPPTSCTAVYSNAVTCTRESSSGARFTYTVANSPVKNILLSPVKITQNGVSPVKLNSNPGITLLSSNQGGVNQTRPLTPQPGTKRLLTKIAPRPQIVLQQQAQFLHQPPRIVQPGEVRPQEKLISCPVETKVEGDRKRKLVLPPSSHSYPCYWAKCSIGFDTEVELSSHLINEHAPISPTSCQWLTCNETPNTRSKYSLLFHLKNIHARAPHLHSLPSCHYTREKVREMLAVCRPWRDITETPVTRSLHMLVALILRNFAYFTPELLDRIETQESRLAEVAMSGQEAGRIVTDILQFAFTDMTELDEAPFITHLPPFR